MAHLATTWLSHVLPLRCLACPARTRGSGPSPLLCRSCTAELHALRCRDWEIDGTSGASGFRYEGAARALVRALKFRGALGAAAPLGSVLGAALDELAPGAVGIVPVPLHWRRRWQRGHNQSAALARAVAAARPGFRVLAALRKPRATRPQVGLGGGRRRRNVDGAFAVARLHIPKVLGARLVLVDDVVTTAATLRAARDVLVAAGASEVTLAAAAVAVEVRTGR